MTAQDLKNSILQLAVQGKLVPQNPSDEPVSELLKRIRAEKERLVKEGIVSIDKKHTPNPISEDDCLFDIPDSWCWVRFADIVTFYSGKTPERHTSDYWSNGKYTWVSIADMVSDGITDISKEKISQKAFDDCFSEKITPAGTMIMSFKLTIGKISILGVDAVHNEAIISIFPFIDDEIIKKYLFKILPLIANAGDSKNAIKGKTLNATSISNLMIPIPPLAEQERIVTKIEELLPLIEEYDKAEKQLSSLNTEFPEKLRKSILQQAVMGKLTERNPADEPASELLKRIRAEKENLIKEGKIKKEKPLPEITDDEKPFDIPESWKWVRLGNAISLLSGTDFAPNEYNDTGKGTIYITGASCLSENGVLENRWTETPKVIAEYGDVLLVCKGSGYGKTVICNVEQAHIARQIMAIKYSNQLDMKYVRFFIMSNFALIKQNGQGVIPGIDRGSVLNMFFPLPPLAEQRRIVARVEELLKICDELK